VQAEGIGRPIAVIETEGKYETTAAKTIKVEGAELTIVQLEATEKATLKVDTRPHCSPRMTCHEGIGQVQGGGPGCKTTDLTITSTGATR